MSGAVRRMFADIAPRYDRANSVLSLGVHHRWRKAAVVASGASDGDKVLDVATGTGDLAHAFSRAVLPNGRVVAGDLCEDMVVLARRKEHERARDPDLHLADALALPFATDEFDIASIGFGIRNVDDPVCGLAEMARVVRPGGHVVVLEFGQPRGFLRHPFEMYSRHVIPRIGGLVTGHREAYEYLPRTSSEFPADDAFLEMMDRTESFARRRSIPLTGGIAYTYVGEVA